MDQLPKNIFGIDMVSSQTGQQGGDAMFNRRDGTAGAGGQFYEIKLSTYFLLKGLSENVDDFYLASNVDEADKFDDIVFKYKLANNRLPKIIFLQAKHKDAPRDDKVPTKDHKEAVNDANDVSDKFDDIVLGDELANNRSKITFLGAKHKDAQRDDKDSKKDNKGAANDVKDIAKDDNIAAVDDKDPEKDGKNRDVVKDRRTKDTVKDTEKSVTIKKLLGDSEKDFSLQKYFTSYLYIKEKFAESDGSDPIFHGKFENCDFIIYSNAQPCFGVNIDGTEELEDCIERVSAGADDILNLSDEKAAKSGYYYKLVYGKNKNKDKDIREVLQYSSDCKRLARELAETVFPSDRKKKKQEGIDVNKPIFERYHIPLVKKVLQKEDDSQKAKFQDSFLNGDGNLSNEDREFRKIFFQESESFIKNNTKISEEELKLKLSSKSIKVSTFFWDVGVPTKYQKLSLPAELVTEDDIKDFFSKLKLFLDQPNEQGLGQIIKQKIQKLYRVDKQDIDTIFADVELKVRNWWQTGNYCLTKNNRIFQDVVRVSVRFEIKEPTFLFVGRSKELENLDKILHCEDKVVMPRTASVIGFGGMGKSELAKKYISEHSKDYDDNFIWIDASRYQTIETSFRRLAQDKLGLDTKDINGKERDIKSIVPQVYDFFAEKRRKCLFVFDNAGMYKAHKDEGAGIDAFLPSNPNDKAFVLITSRKEDFGDIESIPLGAFSVEETVEFIGKSKALESEPYVREVEKLADALQYFPLALIQAVAYIKAENRKLKYWSETTFTITDYLRLYEEKAIELPKPFQEGQSESQLGECYEKSDRYIETVLRSLIVTVDKIRKKVCGDRSLDILSIIAYLAPDKIPVMGLFSKWNEEMLYKAIELLNEYSLVKLEDGYISVHILLQKVITMMLEGQNKGKEVADKTFTLLMESYQSNADDCTLKLQLVPHLEAFLSHMDYWLENDPLGRQEVEKAIASLSQYLQDGYRRMGGNSRRQKELLERALPIWEKQYGLQSVAVIEALTNLGETYGDLGNLHKQKELLEQAVTLAEMLYGPEHFEVAKILTKLGESFAESGDYQKQKELLERVLDIKRKHYGAQHFEVATALVSLGITLAALGNPQEAKDLLESAVRILEGHYGRSHLNVARVLVNLADAYKDLGDYQKQKRTLERAFRILERHYSPEHFERAKLFADLGSAYAILGDLHKQREFLEGVLPVLERRYGHEHLLVAKTLVKLATIYGGLGEPQRKSKLLDLALPVVQKHDGLEHFEVDLILMDFGNSVGDLGDRQHQEDSLRKALAIGDRNFSTAEYLQVEETPVNLICAYGTLGDPHKNKNLFEKKLFNLERYYGHDHIKVAEALVYLGNTYGVLDDHQKQKELLEKALSIQEKHYGHEHFEVGRTLVHLSNSYGVLGDPENQKRLLEMAVKILEKYYNLEFFELGIILLNLGSAGGDFDDLQKGKEFLEFALPVLERHYGHENFQVSKILGSLGKVYGALGDHQKQKELLERELPVAERNYGPDHHEVATKLVDLGNTYGNLGNRQKQKEMLERALPVLKNHYGLHLHVASIQKNLFILDIFQEK